MHMKMLYIKHRSGKIMNNFAISAILAAKELGIDFTLANNMSMAEPGHFEKVCEQYGIKMIHKIRIDVMCNYDARLPGHFLSVL